MLYTIDEGVEVGSWVLGSGSTHTVAFFTLPGHTPNHDYYTNTYTIHQIRSKNKITENETFQNSK
jgi:hypothetical protein